VKRILVIMAAVLVLGGLAGGLTAAFAFNGANDSDSQAQALDTPPWPAPVVRAGDTYELLLDANPTTGYRWFVEFDERFLELVEQRYEPGWGGVGAGGKEVFVFRGLTEGIAEVVFTYKRPWEDEVLKTERVTFNVEGSMAVEKLSLAEALEIAMNSECAVEGALMTDTAFYNPDTFTWWIDLDVKNKKEFCFPVCVVNEATGEAETNWRCMGVPGPGQEPKDEELVPVPLIGSVPGAPLPEGIELPQEPPAEGTIPDTIPLPLPEESIQIAEQFLLNSPLFDGVAESVELVQIVAARCPSCWAFIFKYESEDATAKAVIMVEQGKVTSAEVGSWGTATNEG